MRPIVRLILRRYGFNEGQASLRSRAYHHSYPFMPLKQPPRMLRRGGLGVLLRIFSIAVVLEGAALSLHAQQNVEELYATDASVKGGVILANSGTKVLSGSLIAAGEQAATLKLERGGSMLICPGTSLAVTTSQNGRQLMFSMNAGNIEMDY